jgi:hypothetical protein
MSILNGSCAVDVDHWDFTVTLGDSFPPMGRVIGHPPNPHPTMLGNRAIHDNSWYDVKYLWLGRWKAEYFDPQIIQAE